MVEDREPAQKTPLCVDARLRASAATGVASYAAAVTEALRSAGRAPLRLDDATAGRFGVRAPPLDRARRWLDARSGRVRPLRRDGEWLSARDIFRLAQARFDRSGELLRLVAPGRPGVMHWTYPIPARIVGWRNVYTIHDVVPLTHPGLSPIDPERLRRRLVAIAASADRIVTVSETSRCEILSTLDLPEPMVRDCGGAITGLARGDGGLPAGLQPGGYHVFCGMDEPRKNLDRIVAGWRASGSGRPLVIAGPNGAGARFPDVITVGYLPRPALIDLIAAARAMIFPTLEEGFGLPVIEAMALGTPVVTSARGALAKTAGGAALLVDPGDVGAIAAGIGAVDRDHALVAELRTRGLARAQDFSISAFGRRLIGLYAEFAGESAAAP